MRTVILLLLVLLPVAQLRGQAPAPAGAQPADRVAAEPRIPAPPAGAQAKRNWLLARLIVDQDFDGQKVRSIEEGLSRMTPDQLDVLVQVYQERLRQRDASEQSQLDQARANLEQMKAYRDVLAQDLDNLRAFRQSLVSEFRQQVRPGFWLRRFGFTETSATAASATAAWAMGDSVLVARVLSARGWAALAGAGLATVVLGSAEVSPLRPLATAWRFRPGVASCQAWARRFDRGIILYSLCSSRRGLMSRGNPPARTGLQSTLNVPR